MFKQSSSSVGRRRILSRIAPSLLAGLVASSVIACSVAADTEAPTAGADLPAEPPGAGAVEGQSSESADAVEETPDRVAESRELASFVLAQGKTARFIHVPEVGDVIYEEIGPEHTAPTFGHLGEEVEMLDLFLQLAPDNSAVPRALLESASASVRERVASREVVDVIAQPLRARTLGAEGSTDPAAGQGETFAPRIRLMAEDHDDGHWSCSWSAIDFQNHCTGSGANHFCDSSAQTAAVQRSSSGEFKKSFGFVAICGTSLEIRHRYNGVAGWRTVHDSFVPGNRWFWTRYTGLVKGERRLNYARTVPVTGSYFRAYTAFYD